MARSTIDPISGTGNGNKSLLFLVPRVSDFFLVCGQRAKELKLAALPVTIPEDSQGGSVR